VCVCVCNGGVRDVIKPVSNCLVLYYVLKSQIV